MIVSFFAANKPIIYFTYGMVLFLMGFAIYFHNYHASKFRMAHSMSALAAFGILHGISEWGVIFIPFQQTYLGNHVIVGLYTLDIIIKAVSFAFLFYFGARLLSDTLDRYYWVRRLPVSLLLLWLTCLFLVPWISPDINITAWLAAANGWSRNLLAFPGALLAAHALWLQRKELQLLQEPKVNLHLWGARISFAVYAFWGGLVIPYSSFTPAAGFNQEAVFEFLGIPVAIFRALTGLAMFYYTLRLLQVFNIENNRRVQALERLQLLVSERERIARDLHDGVLQNLYAVGLLLEELDFELDQINHQPNRRYLQISIASLEKIMADIRNYIFGLAPPDLQETDLRQGLQRLLQELENHSILLANLNWHGPSITWPAFHTTNLYLIVKEALNNILKHAYARVVVIDVTVFQDSLSIYIQDDGKGFMPLQQQDSTGGQGFKNMIERARMLAGKLEIHSIPSQGTRVSLNFPLPVDRVIPGGDE